jgi:hypothetical protein
MANPPKSPISARNRCFPAELGGDLLELCDVPGEAPHGRPCRVEAPADLDRSAQGGSHPEIDRAQAQIALATEESLTGRLRCPSGVP